MLNLIYHNQILFAGFFFLISACANAVCDAIKFSSKKNDEFYDNIWHFTKYGIDRPFLFFAGVLCYNVIFDFTLLLNSKFFYYLWHLPTDIKILLGFFACSFFIKEIIYRLLRNHFDVYL